MKAGKLGQTTEDRQTDKESQRQLQQRKVSHEKKYSKISHLYAMLYNVLIYSSVSIRDKKIFKKYTGNSSDIITRKRRQYLILMILIKWGVSDTLI